MYSEGNQASVLTRYLALMFVNGIEKAMIFNLKDETVAENAETSENPGVDMKSFFEEGIKDKEERLKTKLYL